MKSKKQTKRKYEPDPLAQAAGDFVSKLYAAWDNYVKRTDKILETYIASGREDRKNGS